MDLRHRKENSMTDKVQLIRAEIERLYKESYDTAPTVLHHLMDFINSLPEEPVSEDLEEAAKECCFNLQLQEYFKKGAYWQKRKMMNDAIERTVKEDAGGYPYIDATELYDYDNDKPLAKAGDKVKVLIIKED